MPLKKFQVQVQQIRRETTDVIRLELVDPGGAELPEFEVGAHIDVHFANGLIRQYSLCGPYTDRQRYCIGVLKENPGTGGSKYMHESVRVGDVLTISEPKNMFKLTQNADRYILIAGGIGITPILSMTYALDQQKSEYSVHYCTKSQEFAAFYDDIKNSVKQGELEFYFDGGNPENGLNVKQLLKEHTQGTHLYCCGPPSLMDAVRDAVDSWPEDTVHFEYFFPDSHIFAEVPDDDTQEKEFQIRLAASGLTFPVPPYKSIVEVLRENGISVETSCEDGFCGTCLTRYLEGEPEHRDQILDEDDHEDYLLICCARSKTPELVIDL